jgi:hypothetical protein
MRVIANNVEEYINLISDDRREAFIKLRETILANLPSGFQEEMSYGMVGYIVPHSIYPPGYHCTPALPLPFASIAAQKNFIGFYHMGIYAEPSLLQWFVDEFGKLTGKKPDMGKSCTRFRKSSDIPFELIGQLMQKISVQDWINIYEKNYKKK